MRIKMLWSNTSLRRKERGNLREVYGWMNKEDARRWCKRNGNEFVDVSDGSSESLGVFVAIKVEHQHKTKTKP